MTSSIRSRNVRARSLISSSLPVRSVAPTATMIPLIGLCGRVRLRMSRKANHSSRSSSSVLQRPAVSRRMASFVIHQSQFRVPPTPRTLPPLPAGSLIPELRMAVVLPEAEGPIMTYQGRRPRASRPVRPSLELLRVWTARANSASMAAISAR